MGNSGVGDFGEGDFAPLPSLQPHPDASLADDDGEVAVVKDARPVEDARQTLGDSGVDLPPWLDVRKASNSPAKRPARSTRYEKHLASSFSFRSWFFLLSRQTGARADPRVRAPSRPGQQEEAPLVRGPRPETRALHLRRLRRERALAEREKAQAPGGTAVGLRSGAQGGRGHLGVGGGVARQRVTAGGVGGADEEEDKVLC